MNKPWLAIRGAPPSRAIELADELCSLGHEAHCPVEVIRRRVPRQKRVERIERPILGGVIFVKDWPLHYAPSFVARCRVDKLRPLVLFGREVRCSTYELEIMAQSGAEQKEQDAPNLGSIVEITFGPFAGMRGEIISSSDTSVKLSVDGMSAGLSISPCFVKQLVV